jgi:hypothetical protein
MNLLVNTKIEIPPVINKLSLVKYIYVPFMDNYSPFVHSNSKKRKVTI